MPATSLNAADLADLGLTTEADLDASDTAHLEEIAANDPFMADLIASMEQAKPSAEDLAKAMRGTPVADDGDTDAGTGDLAAAEVPDAAADPLLKPGEVPAAAPATAPAPAPAAPVAPTAAMAPATDDELGERSTGDTFVVDIGGGQTASIDTDRAKQLLALDGWAQNLKANPSLANAMAAVEDGRAVAVPAGQYEQFQAWLTAARGGSPAAAPSSAPAAPVAPATFIPDEYSTPAELALHAELQAQRATLAGMQQQQVDTQRAAYDAQMQAHVAQRAETFIEAFGAAAVQYGLSEPEVIAALTFARDANLIAAVNTELAVRHPVTGQVTGEGDPTLIAATTFERALYQMPVLRDRLIASQVQTRLDAERAAIAVTNNKRNRAASLSTAPTAAITSNRDPRDMTPMEREAGIAAELRAAMSA